MDTERPTSRGGCFANVMAFLTLVATSAIPVVLYFKGNEIAHREAEPDLRQIGDLPQFAGADHYMTVRLKNFSTRQDAVITKLRYTISDPDQLKLIHKRHPFVKNVPPFPNAEHIVTDTKIDFITSDWWPDGKAYTFEQDVDIHIPPGKAKSIRLRIGDPPHNKQLWDKAWFSDGGLMILYDNKDLVVHPINLFNGDRSGDIPPDW